MLPDSDVAPVVRVWVTVVCCWSGGLGGVTVVDCGVLPGGWGVDSLWLVGFSVAGGAVISAVGMSIGVSFRVSPRFGVSELVEVVVRSPVLVLCSAVAAPSCGSSASFPRDVVAVVVRSVVGFFDWVSVSLLLCVSARAPGALLMPQVLGIPRSTVGSHLLRALFLGI